MRVLARRQERVLVAGIVLADRAARLHRVGHQPVVDELERRDVVRALEGGVDLRLVVLEEAPVEAEVRGQALMHLRRIGLERRAHVDHRRQLVDVDLDRLGRVARLGERLGDHRGDWLADVAHHPLGEDRVPRLLLLRAVAARHLPRGRQAARVLEVVAGEDPEHPRHPRRRLGVEPGDPAARDVGAQEMGIGLARPVQVVGEPALAGQEAHVLAALQGRADSAVLGHDVLPGLVLIRPRRRVPLSSSAAAAIALTMLW